MCVIILDVWESKVYLKVEMLLTLIAFLFVVQTHGGHNRFRELYHLIEEGKTTM